MALINVNVKPGVPVVAQLDFVGVAAYSAALYAQLPAAPGQWTLVRTLMFSGSSEDAHDHTLTFDPPASSETMLFFLQAMMTSPAGPPTAVSATARLTQAGTVSPVDDGGATTGVPLVVTLEAVLTGAP